MKPTENNRRQYLKVVLAVVVMIILAGLLGWQLGKDGSKNKSDNSTQSTSAGSSTGDVKSLVNYSVPGGWMEVACPTAVYFMPSGSERPDCDANPTAPVILSVDTGNHTDCNQLDNVQGVQKHTCRTVFIDGHKTLQAETIKDGTTTAAYYINTGDGVVKVAYVYTNSSQYQSQFEDLVNNMDVKS